MESHHLHRKAFLGCHRGERRQLSLSSHSREQKTPHRRLTAPHICAIALLPAESYQELGELHLPSILQAKDKLLHLLPSVVTPGKGLHRTKPMAVRKQNEALPKELCHHFCTERWGRARARQLPHFWARPQLARI